MKFFEYFKYSRRKKKIYKLYTELLTIHSDKENKDVIKKQLNICKNELLQLYNLYSMEAFLLSRGVKK